MCFYRTRSPIVLHLVCSARHRSAQTPPIQCVLQSYIFHIAFHFFGFCYWTTEIFVEQSILYFHFSSLLSVFAFSPSPPLTPSPSLFPALYNSLSTSSSPFVCVFVLNGFCFCCWPVFLYNFSDNFSCELASMLLLLSLSLLWHFFIHHPFVRVRERQISSTHFSRHLYCSIIRSFERVAFFPLIFVYFFALVNPRK